MSMLGGVDNSFAYRMLLFAMAIIFLMPTFITVFTDIEDGSVNDNLTELTEGYEDFTGTTPTTEAVWGLTGIYEPYTGGTSYGRTPDGWLYGARLGDNFSYIYNDDGEITGYQGGYSPTQYKGSAMAYTVYRDDDDGVYRYAADTNDGHKKGDIYSAVTMDSGKKSEIFFTSSGKVESGEFFYYEYTGYRYAFQPFANYDAINQNGEAVPVIATTTSLSLIWYEYYGSSGVAGQLILSGSDSGVAYLTAQQIIRAFDSTTSTARFTMVFNGVDMNVYIRLNPYYIAQGNTVEECYNLGYWEIMITSLATDVDAYVGTDYTFNVAEIFDTMIKLFTFDAASLGLSGTMATLASLVFSLPLYAALLSIGMSFYPVLILAGILAAIQSLSRLWPF